MELDNSQLLFIENFKTNLRIFNNDFLILSGPAGTGKTEVIKESAKICEKLGIGYQCLAFTGRAASVLRSRGLTNARTIDSWFWYLKRREVMGDLKKLDKFVIFIDESSMISNSAIIYSDKEPELDFKLDEIMWSTYRHIPCKSIMFVFVGDENQLPPIKHDYAPALDIDYFKNRYGLNGASFQLNKPHRQKKESEISEIAENFKNKNNSENLKIPPLSQIKGDIKLLKNSEVIPTFFDLYFRNKHSVKIITATNKKADFYNFSIKEKLSPGSSELYEKYHIPTDYLEPQKGDILQIFENTRRVYEYPLYNGQFVEILELGPVREHVLSKGNRNFDRIPFINQDILVDTVSDSGEKSGNLLNITISIDHLVNNSNLNKVQYEFFDKKDTGMLDSIKDYEYISGNKRVYSQQIYNPTLARFGYAITGHKAQGGGWENIIIDFSGFNDDKGHLPPSWIYTAITRAKSNLYVVNYPTEDLNE